MNDTGAHYHIVAHSRKGNDRSYDEIPGLQEIKGANAFGVETFNCITIWRNNAKQVMLEQAIKRGGSFKSSYGDKSWSKEELEMKPDSILWVNKQKVGGQTGRYDMFYDKNTYRFSRTKTSTPRPYAKEIYETYIENYEEEDDAF
jgi:hypothetical protein